MKICKVESCNNKAYMKQLCRHHYYMYRKYGDAEYKKKKPLEIQKPVLNNDWTSIPNFPNYIINYQLLQIKKIGILNSRKTKVLSDKFVKPIKNFNITESPDLIVKFHLRNKDGKERTYYILKPAAKILLEQIRECVEKKDWEKIDDNFPSYRVNYQQSSVKRIAQIIIQNSIKIPVKEQVLKPFKSNEKINKFQLFEYNNAKKLGKVFKIPTIQYIKKLKEQADRKIKKHKFIPIKNFPDFEINVMGTVKSVSRPVNTVDKNGNKSSRIISKILTPQMRISNKKKIVYFRYMLSNEKGRRSIRTDILLKSHFSNSKFPKSKECPTCGYLIHWVGTKQKKCLNPSCIIPENFDRPETERKLFQLQKNFVESGRDPEKLVPQYKLLCVYARSLILKTLIGKFKLEAPTLLEKSHDVAVELVCLYLKHSDFIIKSSFGSYMNFKVKEILWKASPEEKSHESLQKIISVKGTSKELINLLGSTIPFNNLFSTTEQSPETAYLSRNSENIIADIMELIFKLERSLEKYNFNAINSIMLMVGIAHIIKRTFLLEEIEECFFQKMGKVYASINVESINKILQVFFVELYKLLKQTN